MRKLLGGEGLFLLVTLVIPLAEWVRREYGASAGAMVLGVGIVALYEARRGGNDHVDASRR